MRTYGRRWITRWSPSVGVVPSKPLCEHTNRPCPVLTIVSFGGITPQLPAIDPVPEFGLGGSHFGEQSDRIETRSNLTQSLLDHLIDSVMRERPVARRLRPVIALDDLGAFAALLLQLERRLEEVYVKARSCIETRKQAGRLDAFEAAIADQSADHSAILLLDMSLIVLLVGSRACDLDLTRAAPGHDDVVHEGAVVVKVEAA